MILAKYTQAVIKCSISKEDSIQLKQKKTEVYKWRGSGSGDSHEAIVVLLTSATSGFTI